MKKISLIKAKVCKAVTKKSSANKTIVGPIKITDSPRKNHQIRNEGLLQINLAKIVQVAVPVPLHTTYDYLLPEKYTQTDLIGVRVKIPFGKREAVGVIVNIGNQSNMSYKSLKYIHEILDLEPIFSPESLKFLARISCYYHHPIGDVISAALPILLRQGRSAIAKTLPSVLPGIDNFLSLNTAQQFAINTIKTADQFKVFLLHGITGSGKTEVYLKVIANILAKGKQALILVPEISLTPQTVARFHERFSVPIAVMHSGLTERGRLDNWLAAKNGTATVIIGTRSAILTPLANLGIIIIDEEHDLSFKQQEGLRYHARDMAILRAQQINIPIVLGSATPSLESFFNAQQQRYQLLELTERAGNSQIPLIILQDIRQQKLEGGLSQPLIAAMQKHLQNNGQVLLFLNRRGFAPVLLCHACGWVAVCERCDAKMIYHQNPSFMQCHHCTITHPLIEDCPNCKGSKLVPIGLGTQRLSQVLTKHFPNYNIARMDRDSTRHKGALQSILQEVHNGQTDILVGTQMLAKGHHFPKVTLVAIVDADSGLYSPDFRALERTAQLLLQVAGRAGRADYPGEVIVQTHNPDHPLLQCLLKEGYSKFLQACLQERELAGLPPFSYQALIRAEAIQRNYPLQFLNEVKACVNQNKFQANSNFTEIEILGPIPALLERKAGRFRAQLLLQSKNRSLLHNLLNNLLPKIEKLPTVRRVRWILDIDPVDIA